MDYTDNSEKAQRERIAAGRADAAKGAAEAEAWLQRIEPGVNMIIDKRKEAENKALGKKKRKEDRAAAWQNLKTSLLHSCVWSGMVSGGYYDPSVIPASEGYPTWQEDVRQNGKGQER